MTDDLRDDNLEEHENANALLDDSIFEEVDLDLIDEEELKPIILKNKEFEDNEEDNEDKEILDELDALIAEEDDEEELDFYGDEDEE